MKSDNKKTGNKGEELACGFLKKKGYLIVERNFRTRFGEIDIVCLDGEKLVFVEVKTKIGHDFGEPEEMVSKSKLAQVQRMGEVFVEMNNLLVFDSDLPNFSARMPPLRSAQRGYLRQNSACPAPTNQIIHNLKWNGRCRVDVVGIVLNGDMSVETIRHHEAVY